MDKAPCHARRNALDVGALPVDREHGAFLIVMIVARMTGERRAIIPKIQCLFLVSQLLVIGEI